VVLVEQGGQTTLTSTVIFPSQEVRDVVLKSGMEHGAAEEYERLAGYLASITRVPDDEPVPLDAAAGSKPTSSA